MATELKIDKLTVRAFEDRKAMGEAAAETIAGKINELLSQQEFVNMIFAAAPSQNEFLADLIQKNNIDWQRVNAFHMDEYIGLPENAAQRFGIFLKERLFSLLPFHSVNYINGNAVDLNAECFRYGNLLQKYPPDIVCMGIGENGHIAFNDPHVADFDDPHTVKIVDLDESCRLQQVKDGCFGGLGKVPTHALTLTIPALMSGQYIYCIVPGKNKANAVNCCLAGSITERWPASILRKHANALLFLDNNSSSLLKH